MSRGIARVSHSIEIFYKSNEQFKSLFQKDETEFQAIWNREEDYAGMEGYYDYVKIHSIKDTTSISFSSSNVKKWIDYCDKHGLEIIVDE